MATATEARPKPRGGWPQGANDDALWTAILGLSTWSRRSGFDPTRPLRLAMGPGGRLTALDASGRGQGHWSWWPGRGWAPEWPIEGPGASALIELYSPLCTPAGDGCRVLAHLGQSLDGFIATGCGDSCFVTGPENIRHLHRMRALCDAVLVGTETALNDDPRLTARLVPGDNPVRVVLDRCRRLPAGLRIFTDGAAETLLVCDQSLVRPGQDRVGQARVIGVRVLDGRLDLCALCDRLTGMGIGRLFVEGGGATVSAFMAEGLLHRLQIAVAPLLIGAGRPGLRIPAPERLADARRPTTRLFRMGADLLYDMDLASPDTNDPSPPDSSPLQRIG